MRRCRQSGLQSGPHGSLIQEGSGIQARVSAGARVTALLKNPSQPIHDAVEYLFRPPHFALGLRAPRAVPVSGAECRTRHAASIQWLRSACWKTSPTIGSALRAPWPHGPHRRAVVVEADPRAGHELRMHHDEPAVGVLLRGAGLASHVRLNAVRLRMAAAGAFVDDAAHHVHQLQRLRAAAVPPPLPRTGWDSTAQQLAVRGLRRGRRRSARRSARRWRWRRRRRPSPQRDGARAQRERKHRVELALAHAHAPGAVARRARGPTRCIN